MKKFFEKILGKPSVILIILFAICIIKSNNVFAVGTTQSLKINNTILSFNNIIYVDANKGDDTNGDGSINKPYASIDNAINKAVSKDAIFIKAGTYHLKPMHVSNYGAGGISDEYKELTIVGENEKTILEFHGSEVTEVRDAAAFDLLNPNSKVMNLTYNYYPGKETNYSNAIFIWSRGSFYNIFVNIKGNTKASYSYYNGGSANFPKVYNCVFHHETNDISPDYSGSPFYENCLSNCNPPSGSKVTNLIKNFDPNNLEALKNDSQLKNVGTGTNPDGTQANIGVYGGEFAWGYSSQPVSINSLTIYKTTDSLIVGQTDNIVATVAPDYATNKTLVWTSSDSSVATVDSTGKVIALKAGTATITATTQDGSNLSASCILNVRNPITREILTINMLDSSQKKYDLSEDELNNFLIWYYDRANNQTSIPYYIFYVPATDSSPAKKDYILFNVIKDFEVEEYTK